MKLRNPEIFKIGLIFTNSALISLLVIMSVYLQFRSPDSPVKGFLGLLLITSLPINTAFIIWHYFFSGGLKRATSLSSHILQTILGAFFISFIAIVGTTILIGILNGAKTSSFSGALMLSLYGGLVYSTPFNLVFGFLAGGFLYCRKKRGSKSC